MEPVFIKIIVLVVTLVLSLLFGLIPLRLVNWMKRTEDREKRLNIILSFLTCFSGGIFLGAVLIHLFPEVIESFNESLKVQGIVTEYPLGFLVICLGLFLVLLLENLVITCKLHAPGNATLPKDDKSKYDQPSDKENPNVDSNQKVDTVSASDVVNRCKKIERDSLLATNGLNSRRSLPESPRHSYMSIADMGEMETSLSVKSNSATPNKTREDIPVDGSLKITSAIRSFVLLMALGFHSIFEGLAVGLQTNEKEIIALFIAIDSHKFVVAFSLGLEMSQTVGMSPRTRIFSMIAFALMTPIGIAIGMLIVDTGNGHDQSRNLVASVLQALATGTFLYVTFFEILPKELSKKRTYDLIRVLMVIIGFGFMAGIKAIEHEH